MYRYSQLSALTDSLRSGQFKSTYENFLQFPFCLTVCLTVLKCLHSPVGGHPIDSSSLSKTALSFKQTLEYLLTGFPFLDHENMIIFHIVVLQTMAKKCTKY